VPHRITDRATFGALARARRVRQGPLTVAFVPPDAAASEHGSPDARVGYSAGRKVGGAVVRNRVRRRLRAACREHAALLVPGAAYLVSASPASAAMSYQDLAAHLAEALERLRSGARTGSTPVAR
jgi:ribonuclease P protein component